MSDRKSGEKLKEKKIDKDDKENDSTASSVSAERTNRTVSPHGPPHSPIPSIPTENRNTKKQQEMKSSPSIQGSTGLEGTTLVGGEAGDKIPGMLHYERQEGRFAETPTLVNGEDNGGAFRGFGQMQQQRNDGMEQAHLSQMQYNHNRVALDRSINTATGLVSNLRGENKRRPVHYPAGEGDPDLDARLNSRDSRLAMQRQKSSGKIEEVSTDEEHQCSMQILRVNYRLDRGSGDVAGSLDKKGVAALLDEKLAQASRHLASLRDRIDDTTSKVLVTGDVNSGKSAFCNALLRRKVLPEDQEPCTSVFCEIVDAQQNGGVEEVHAVSIGAKYIREDHRTYQSYPLNALEELVYEPQKYSLLVVYVKDNRPAAQSLLHNGVVDIRLIDAPGLNVDSYHTTQLYVRQEEIDLVIFVVNAANHFTLSGREFVSSAASDRNLMFIVVNRFDEIRHRDRCQSTILEQLQALSPETYKNAGEFLHFVSSRNPGGDGPGGNPDDPGPEGPTGPGTPNFDRLEAALRRFVLEKRALSKLLPAKTYLLKLYGDLRTLAALNIQHYTADKAAIQEEVTKITPDYEAAVHNSVKANQETIKITEESAEDAYDHARKHIRDVIDSVGTAPLGIKFGGYSEISKFATQTQEAVIDRIVDSVSESEDFARNITSDGVGQLRRLGSQYLGADTLPATRFVPQAMYSRKKDLFVRQIDMGFNFSDFIDPSIRSFCSVIGISEPSSSTTGALASVAFSRLWKTGLSGLAVMYGPQLLSALTGIQSVAHLLPNAFTRKVMPVLMGVVGVGLPLYYLYKDAPHAYQRKVVKKIKRELEAEDYVDANSVRISKEVRKVLNFPANDISIGMNGLIESQSTRRTKLMGEMKKGEAGLKFYKDLAHKVQDQQALVENIDMGVD